MIHNKLVKKELKRRAASSISPIDLLDSSFKHQTEFIKDPNKLKVAFCTRRAAKSYTGGLYLVQTCLENPGVSCLFIGLTRLSAKGIVWKDVLKVINRKYKLGIKFNDTLLTATFANGSVIYLMGVDSSEDEKDKALGQKYKLAIIDEAASYSINLRELVYGILKPASVDYNGSICLLGTSGNLTKGLFYDITTGVEPGWSVHRWTAHDNPYVVKQWQAELDDIAKNRPLFMETPLFKQWYLNQWVVDIDSLVYKFNEDRNLYNEIPMHIRGDWQYLLGVDLGYEDPSAFVVVAYHEYDKILYVVDTYKRSKMDVTDVANKIKELKTKYSIHKVIVDNANKQAIEEIQKRHQLPLIPADKTGKADFIEIMNAELIQGRIKVQPKLGTDLISEWQGLIWKEKGLKREENPTCDNHLADACLYAWRYCYSYLSEMPVLKPKYGTPEWQAKEVEDMEEAAIAHFTALEDAATGWGDDF